MYWIGARSALNSTLSNSLFLGKGGSLEGVLRDQFSYKFTNVNLHFNIDSIKEI